MKKEMTLETNDEAVDLSRRSMMSRLGLVASVAIAAPVLMTMSTSALANHKRANASTGKGTGADTSAVQSDGKSNASNEEKGEGGGSSGGSTCPEGMICLP